MPAAIDPQALRQIAPGEQDLEALLKAGLLIWRDPKPFPPGIMGENYHRHVRLHRKRADFTEDVLQRWAANGELYTPQGAR